MREELSLRFFVVLFLSALRVNVWVRLDLLQTFAVVS
jgi:hypothetical protein